MENWLRNNWSFAVAGAGVLLAFIGTMAPAVRIPLFGSINYVETDDGKIALVCVLLSAVFWLWFALTKHWSARAACLVAGIVMVGVAIVDLVDTHGRLADIDEYGLVSLGPALYLVAVGGLALVLMALVSLPGEHSPARARAEPDRTTARFFQTLAGLHDRGVLTDQEYEERRQRQVRRLLDQKWTLSAVRHAIGENDNSAHYSLDYSASNPAAIIKNLELLKEIQDKGILAAEEYREYHQRELDRFSALPHSADSSSSGVVEKMNILKELHDRSLLTDVEYEERRQHELEHWAT